jgi:hypothetical protein
MRFFLCFDRAEFFLYDIAMFKPKTYYYLVDKLNPATAETLKKAMTAVSGVSGVGVRIRDGIVEIAASRDVETELRMACDIAGTVLRTKVSGRKL